MALMNLLSSDILCESSMEERRTAETNLKGCIHYHLCNLGKHHRDLLVYGKKPKDVTMPA